MKIALLHLDLAGGPAERNERLLLAAIRQAAEAGADWIVTPETAREGYFFYKKNPAALSDRPPHGEEEFFPFLAAAKDYGVTLFLSGAEKTETGEAYNSCFLISPEGKEIGCHRKMYSHQSGAEGWLTLGREAKVYDVDGVKTGLFVCADTYYEKPSQMVKEGGAELVLVSAAWPPGGCCKDPVAVWKRASLWAGCPLCVCNQTGRYDTMDMTLGESAVLAQGECLFTYHGNPAILLWEFDGGKKEIRSHTFEIIPFLLS